MEFQTYSGVNYYIYQHGYSGSTGNYALKVSLPTPAPTPMPTLATGPITLRYSTNLCVDMDTGNNNLYMHPCHGEWNQQFYYEPSTQQIKLGSEGCVYWHVESGENLKIDSCRNEDRQQWVWKSDYSWQSRRLEGSWCVDDGNGNLYMHPCVSHVVVAFLLVICCIPVTNCPLFTFCVHSMAETIKSFRFRRTFGLGKVERAASYCSSGRTK